MARYGAMHLQWAPFNGDEETADASDKAYPKYGAAMNLGSLVVVNDAPAFATAENYGDNTVQERVVDFQKVEIDVEVTEMTNQVASAVFGATINETTDLEHGLADDPPYGCLGFVTCKQIKKAKKWSGVFYPKVQATPQGTTYNTKGASITFANGKAHFTGLAAKNGKWKVDAQDFDTEAEAKAWVDDKVKQTV